MNLIDRGDGIQLAYEYRHGKGPDLVFLPGYRSDMHGSKATALDKWCALHGRAILRLDYSGHGQSGGRIEDGTIGGWADDAFAVIRQVVKGPLVLVGSSMGGWIALMLATRVTLAGMVGIAAAPDFTEELIWNALTEAERNRLLTEGSIDVPNAYGNPYKVSRAFIEDGRQHLLLNGPIRVTAPIRLLHGMHDRDVPWRTALRMGELLESQNVQIILVKDGDHRLSRPQDLALLTALFGENGL